MSLKLQEYHSYRSLIPCKKITWKSTLETKLDSMTKTRTPNRYSFWQDRHSNTKKKEPLLSNVSTPRKMCAWNVQLISHYERRRTSKTHTPGEKWQGNTKLDLTVGVSKASNWHIHVRVLWEQSHEYLRVSTFWMSQKSRRPDWEKGSLTFCKPQVCRGKIYSLF